MPQTQNFNIPYPDGSSPYAPLHSYFANLAQGADAAITSAVAGAPRAAGSASARDNVFPNPKQGDLVFRTDRGYVEQYYSSYNASTNPLGGSPAGWYPFFGKMPEIYLPLTGIQEVKPDIPNTSHSRPLDSGTTGTPRVTPGASEYFSIDGSRAITFNRACEVTISWALTQVGGAGSGSGRVLAMINDSSWSVPSVSTRTAGESEIPYSAWRQWHISDTPHSAFSAGDVLRFGFFGQSISGGMTFGTAGLARACYFRVTVTGPRGE